jgi:Virulence factor BrkB
VFPFRAEAELIPALNCFARPLPRHRFLAFRRRDLASGSDARDSSRGCRVRFRPGSGGGRIVRQACQTGRSGKCGSGSGVAAEREQYSVGDHRHRCRYRYLNRHRHCRIQRITGPLNLIWKVPATGGLGVARFLKSRFLSLCVILAIRRLLLVSLLVSTALSVFSDHVDQTLSNFSIILYLVHHVLSFGFTTAFFGLIFKILTDYPAQWRDVWLSAAITSLLFSIGKHLISVYIGSSNMASSYAASALIIVFVWVYYPAQIFLLGAEFAKAYGDQRRGLEN